MHDQLDLEALLGQIVHNIKEKANPSKGVFVWKITRYGGDVEPVEGLRQSNNYEPKDLGPLHCHCMALLNIAVKTK